MDADERPIADHASMGGKARAQALSPEERSEIARNAVKARWRKAGKEIKEIPVAVASGVLKIGSAEIDCANLEDGTRVLSRIGFLRAIGRTGKAKGGRAFDDEFKTPVFLTAQNLKQFISKELRENSNPVPFRLPNGTEAIGYRAELLPQVCQVFIDAKDEGALRGNQIHIAEACKILLRGFTVVGVNALVDEATGFQDERDRDALAKILEAFVAKEIQKWVPTFRPDFYKEMFRLRGWAFNGTCKRPQFAGKLTNDLVYKRLAPGVLAELRRLNPSNDKGQRKSKHHQWLTQELGHPKLKEHVASVTTLMRAADDWKAFEKMLDRALPRHPDVPLFDSPTDGKADAE